MAAGFDTFTISAIDLNGTFLRAPDNFNEDPNVTLLRLHADGRMDPQYSVVMTNAPRFSFTTPEMDTALALIGKHGVEVTTVVIYWAKKDPTARSTGSDHITTTINDGVIAPLTASWNGQNEAWQLGVEILTSSQTGATDPFVYGTASLPAQALILSTFTGGKLTINGSEVECWQNATFDFGLQTEQIFHKGLKYPPRAEVSKAIPSFEVTNLDPGDRNTYTQYGTRLTAAVLSMRKNQDDDAQEPTRVADASLEHVNLTMVDGIIHPLATTASDGAHAQQGLRAVFDENASTAAVVIGTSEAIA